MPRYYGRYQRFSICLFSHSNLVQYNIIATSFTKYKVRRLGQLRYSVDTYYVAPMRSVSSELAEISAHLAILTIIICHSFPLFLTQHIAQNIMVLVNNNNMRSSESIDSCSSTIHANITKEHIFKNDTFTKNVQSTPDIIIELKSTSCPKVQTILNSYKGHLVDVGSCLLEGLRNTAPHQLAARVGDYNENLFYEMQDNDKDISGIIRGFHGDNLQLQEDIDAFESSICASLEHTNLTYRGSFMRTESTIYQPAHVDYDYPILEQYGDKLFLAFFPLTQEGAYLQLWQEPSSTEDFITGGDGELIPGTVVFIPYGKMLIMPSDTIHGGGFKRGSSGNLRFHLYIALEEDQVRKENNITLLDHPMNKYTEKHDRRHELCERFVDAEGLESLLGDYFDVEAECSGVTNNDFNDGSCMKSLKLDYLNAIETDSATRSASHVNLFGLSEEVEVM